MLVAYDAYGGFATTAPAADPFRYNGQWGYYTDIYTGFVLCTNRYYDPAQGHWLTRDPIGYAGGINLYGYCGDGPVGWADPDGLDDNFPPNGGLSGDNWRIFWQWIYQSGGNKRYYGAGDPGTKALRAELGPTFRQEFQQSGGSSKLHSEGTLEAAEQSASDWFFMTPNTTQQYVGGFVWWAIQLPHGKVRYEVSNSLSQNSFFYHIPLFQHPERGPFTPAMGDIDQWFSWTEDAPCQKGKSK